MSHVDYPHEPGTLYDCPDCEMICYCFELSGVTCVACSIIDETIDPFEVRYPTRRET